MKNVYLIFLLLIVVLSCGDDVEGVDSKEENVEVEESMKFETLSAEETGIDFLNTIKESEDFNFYNYEYIYNGGGVAVGDINNDGLVDVFFTGNQVENKLYLNKGEMKFEDISKSAFSDSANHGWHTGVTMVDINADGWLDIYVCRSGNPEERNLLSNLLFVNNKDNTFTDRSAEYGVDVEARSTQAAFFDYDNDGDVDLYVLNHPIQEKGDRKITAQEYKDRKKYGMDADVLLENRGGKFIDVSLAAGIENNCFGLGLALGDLDGNGFTDIYVSNDYQDQDFMYMNNGDGTFSQEIDTRTNHTSNFSMGNDMADYNNDGFLDVVTVDMAAEDHIRSKRNMGAMSTQSFWDLVLVGFHYQYMFNGLQLNIGNGTFSEIAHLAGISQTDWSWSPLLADFDNDGFKDLFITNGYKREARDNDYTRAYRKKMNEGEIESFEDGLALMPTSKIFNYIYKNTGDLKFKKMTEDWGFDIPVNSNGSAFADFDNDGDLDLVVNNMEELSFIMENKLSSTNNYLRINLEGYGNNQLALGAKITIYHGDQKQYQEHHLSRGYESSVENVIHFGLGKSKKVDKLVIVLPNGDAIVKTDLDANKVYDIKSSEAKAYTSPKIENGLVYRDIGDSLLMFIHKEKMMNDFESERLLPNKMSQLGPFISKGDVNGDGLDDIYISGAIDNSGKLFIQTPGKGFIEKNGVWQKEKIREELGSKFFDADGDGDLDLYVISGGNEYHYNSVLQQDQLYINDGKGNFTNETSTRLPLMESSGQRLDFGDYDNDGDLDLFVGGRQTPGYYPFAPRSFLLQNNGAGFFTDVTAQSSEKGKTKADITLMGPGMITEVIFDDFDHDGDLDLVMVGEWMKITFFENKDGVYSNVTDRYNPDGEIGWWYSISKADLNGDGKSDYVVGNLGENNKFHPSKEKPLEIYCHDFDANGTYDIVLAKYQNNVCYPVRGRQCSSEQMPFIVDKFPSYSDYASADLTTIYGEEALSKALHYSATNFSSVVLLSSESGYETQKLPVFAQFAPINKSIIKDVNNDGNLDVIAVGNNYSVEVETVRYDAGSGVVLLGDGKGDFKQLSSLESGLFENKDCKDMIDIKYGGVNLLITVSNRDKAKTFIQM